MAWTTGTALNHADLLDKLRLWAGTIGWTVLQYAPGATMMDEANLKLRGPGAGTERQVFINIRATANPNTPYYSWQITGAIGYDSSQPMWMQPGEMLRSTCLNLWQNEITYWFFGNDRRIVIVAKCSTGYMSAYLGFFLPFGNPEQYAFPLYVAADYHSRTYWSVSNTARRMFCDPGYGGTGISNAFVRSPTGSWLTGANHEAGANNNQPTGLSSAGGRFFMWPWHSGVTRFGTSYTAWPGVDRSGANGGGAADNVVPTRQGERFVWPIMVCPTDQPPLGVLDGVYFVPGFALGSEQELTIGDRTFKIFQNISRNSGDDFFAVELG